MAATLIDLQLYSQNHWRALDGVQTVWNFAFSGGYILPEHVKAYYIDAAGVRVTVTVTADMLTGPYQLTVTPALPTTVQRFCIYRDTPKDEPLVDFEGGARQTERNLDRLARQAIFCAAEILDSAVVATQLEFEDFGYKALKRNAYTGASSVQIADNGKAHFKTDATEVTVSSASLPDEFLTTIINHNASTSMTVTFSGAVGVMQGSDDAAGKASWSLKPRQSLNIAKVGSGFFYISGYAT